MPIKINLDLLNKVHTLPQSYLVDTETVQAFAVATGNTNLAHHNLVAAKSLAYPNLLATPTFSIILAQQVDKHLLTNLAIDFFHTTILHVEQKIVNHNPIFVGDNLQTTGKVTKIVNRNSFVLLTTEAEIKTVEGVFKSTLTSTIMIKENLR